MNSEYEKLATGIRGCNACTFRDASIEPLAPAWVQIPVQILFVGENPSWAEDQDVPFAESTISGRALDQHYLEPLGLSREHVWITDLFKCRYPKEVYQDKPKNEKLIQSVAATCAYQWLAQEVALANPTVVVTLSDKEVYQRLRRAFDLQTPSKFANAVGRAHSISLNGVQVTLFPMVHPDVSRPLGDGDNRKPGVRSKWAGIHQKEHIPALKEILQAEG